MGAVIVIVAPDPAWAGLFASEGARLRDGVGVLARRIDHIGSTSVPGLAAKPIVDIQVSVPAIDDLDAFRAPIEALGHALIYDERPIGHVFFADPDRERRRFNVHVCEVSGDWERPNLLFRDWLRAHPTEAGAYQLVKQSLGRRFDPTEVEDYAEAKSVWIKPALTRAEAWASATGWRLPPSDA
jgi:GrpB-like predicted nucleotidyltransferase (UPF0157 family)